MHAPCLYLRLLEEGGLSPTPSSLYNCSPLIPWGRAACLPAGISYKHSTLINLLIYQSLSLCLSLNSFCAERHKEPQPQ